MRTAPVPWACAPCWQAADRDANWFLHRRDGRPRSMHAVRGTSQLVLCGAMMLPKNPEWVDIPFEKA